MKTKSFLFLVAISAIVFSSCKPDVPAPLATFSFTISVDTVKFKNTSTGATSYLWDFGDKSTSTENEPVHIYAASGTYTVTLIATNEGGSNTFSETISITRPPVFVDGVFTDWSEISANKLFIAELPDTANLKAIKTLKVTSDANYIFFYVKMDSLNVGAFDIFINSDNVATTGNNSWLWSGGCAADYLIDGLLSLNMADAAVYNFPATETDQTKWAWVNTVPAGSGVVTMSKPKLISGTLIEFEGKIAKELVSNNWAANIGIGVFVQTPTWEIPGALPGGGGNDFKLLEVTLQ